MKVISTLTVLFLILNGCQDKKEANLNQNIIVQNNNKTIEFRTDPKLETLYIAFLLADYPIVTKHQSAYVSAVNRHFQNHREHPTVQLLRKIMYQNFNFDYAVNWLYQFSDFPKFEKIYHTDYDFTLRKMNEDTLELFRQGLIEFYIHTNCNGFFKSQESFITEMTDRVSDSFKRKDIIQVIENYFGIVKNGTYTVILSPLLHSGGYAVDISGGTHMFAVVGPSGISDSFPVFDRAVVEYDLVIHEFSHNYANAVVDKFLAKSKQFEAEYYTPLQEILSQEGCNSWEAFMYELVVRATTIRIVYNTYGHQAAAELMEYEESVGFGLTLDVAKQLEIYEKHRDKYATLQDFFPEILNELARKSSKTF